MESSGPCNFRRLLKKARHKASKNREYKSSRFSTKFAAKNQDFGSRPQKEIAQICAKCVARLAKFRPGFSQLTCLSLIRRLVSQALRIKLCPPFHDFPWNSAAESSKHPLRLSH